MKIDKYDVELADEIEKLANYEGANIWSFNHNVLESLWCRNYKDKIKVETVMSIPVDYYGEKYQSNFYFTITPEQAQKIIKELQQVLNYRKKREQRRTKR